MWVTVSRNPADDVRILKAHGLNEVSDAFAFRRFEHEKIVRYASSACFAIFDRTSSKAKISITWRRGISPKDKSQDWTLPVLQGATMGRQRPASKARVRMASPVSLVIEYPQSETIRLRVLSWRPSGGCVGRTKRRLTSAFPKGAGGRRHYLRGSAEETSMPSRLSCASVFSFRSRTAWIRLRGQLESGGK